MCWFRKNRLKGFNEVGINGIKIRANASKLKNCKDDDEQKMKEIANNVF